MEIVSHKIWNLEFKDLEFKPIKLCYTTFLNT